MPAYPWIPMKIERQPDLGLDLAIGFLYNYFTCIHPDPFRYNYPSLGLMNMTDFS